MNVVFVLPYFAPAWGFGGVVRAAHGLSTALVARGHTITVITTDAGDNNARVLPAESIEDGVRVVRCRNRLPWLRRVNLSSPAGMDRMLQDILSDADVLHVHELRTVENLIALAAARRFGVPVVLSPHGTLPYAAGRGGIKRGWDWLFGRWMVRSVDHVLALTADEASEARSLWRRQGISLSESQVSIVSNGVDAESFAALPPGKAFRERWDIPGDAGLVLFLGRLHERKGVHHLIDALALMPETWLAVVGPDEGQLAALQAQAERSGVRTRVFFAGLLTGQEKLAALAAADVLALPAVGEGLPMVVLEAMAAGLPVAVSDGCHLPEAIAAGAAVRLEPLTGRAIAAVLLPLLADPRRRQAMAEQGRKLIAGRYAWSQVAATVEDVYRQVSRSS